MSPLCRKLLRDPHASREVDFDALTDGLFSGDTQEALELVTLDMLPPDDVEFTGTDAEGRVWIRTRDRLVYQDMMDLFPDMVQEAGPARLV